MSYTDLNHVEQLKLKKKGDLISFAARHPGALTAHFLAGVYARLSKGTISRTSQLREVSVASWAHQFSGLTEVRDVKEVLTLAEILDHVNRKEIARALDVLCQRILAIQAAKGKGGSWEKAEALELVNTHKNAGIIIDAGIDQRVRRRRFWEAWQRGGGSSSLEEGFDRFYLRSVVALSASLKTCGWPSNGGSSFQSVFHKLRSLRGMFEFRKPSSEVVGLAPESVFPLPPLSVDGRWAAVDSARTLKSQITFHGGNLILDVLNNWMHGGGEIQDVLSQAQKTQKRVHSRVLDGLMAQVLTDEPILTPKGVDEFCRQTQSYTGSSVVLALGVRGGVPDVAADVPLAAHLQEHFPLLARQVVDPKTLLLPSNGRPRRVKRGYTFLSHTYPELVKRNVKAGLHGLKKPHQVAKHRGVKCLAGAFAVVKDDKEDRVITDPSVNQLLDPDKLPRPKFAYIPKLRTLTVPSSGVIAVTKRDARHYFHRLQIGRRWHRWLCGPSVRLPLKSGGISEVHPASRATPMGFGPSAGWAQGLTDTIAVDAQLPQSLRVHPDFVIPEGLPVWGSIIDDVWALEHVEEGSSATVGPDWLNKPENAWILRGVKPNEKKSVDGALGEEIQGYYVHPQAHWVGLSFEKRRHLYQATIHVLLQRRVHFGVMERLIGKHGFCHSARPCLRSVFEKTYAWLSEERTKRHKGRAGLLELPEGVWIELMVSALLLPFAHFNLSAKWSTRVEASDSSMTGLGRAIGVMPRHVVQTIARFCDHASVYTNLRLPWSVGLTEEHKCPLGKVRLPINKGKWKEFGIPWSPLHITLGESDAVAWSVDDRLNHNTSLAGERYIQILDSAAMVGALSKGRSSSELINRRCRRVAAANVAGNADGFYPWTPSAENPADRPSRLFEPNAKAGPMAAELDSTDPIVDLRELCLDDSQQWYFIHFCSGPFRAGDLGDEIEKMSHQIGVHIRVLRVDPLAELVPGCKGDLFNPNTALFLLDLIHKGKVIGGFGSPPCSTVSAARHRPLSRRGGPRPLRSRSDPWIPLKYCSPKEVQAVRIGSLLFLLCLGMLGEIRAHGGWVGLEHPADREQEPYPSFFNTVEVQQFLRFCGMAYYVTHQCRFGAKSVKPTGLLLPWGCSRIQLKGNHRGGHPPLIGIDHSGRFLTTPAAHYPQGFCHALSELFVHRLVQVESKGYTLPFAPKPDLKQFLQEPWTQSRYVRWQWPQPSAAFLVGELAAYHSFQVSRGVGAPQQ